MCSPARRQLRPRVSSAVFPSSPSYFYARTSAECDSPRMIRHAHSHSNFPTESIPLCQVNQPRSDSTRHVVSITVPVIASNVNEKAQGKKTGVSEQQKNFDEDAITEFVDGELFKKDKLDNCPCSLGSDDSCKSSFYHLKNAYQNRRSLEERGMGENEKENGQSKTQLRIDFVDLSFSESSSQGYKPQQPAEKPKRYNRSSLKKQKVRLCEDPDCSTNLPIYEFECNNPDHQENANPRKSRHPRSAEMKRKAFLRKISLQDTYVNYNQDYWLDYKKSLKFHKSIDLGYFGTDGKAKMEAEIKKSNAESQDCQEQLSTSNHAQFLAITRQSKLPFKYMSGGNLKKSDSDPIIFPTLCSCTDCHMDTCKESTGLFMDISERKEITCSKNFFPSSNNDIPLFLERNGVIETDFDILDEDRHEDRRSKSAEEWQEETETSESEARDFGITIDSSNFYEVQLNNSEESESEKVKSNKLHFWEKEAFFETFPSTSGESDVFYETDPLMVFEDRRPELPNFCSSSSPPKSSPD